MCIYQQVDGLLGSVLESNGLQEVLPVCQRPTVFKCTYSVRYVCSLEVCIRLHSQVLGYKFIISRSTKLKNCLSEYLFYIRQTQCSKIHAKPFSSQSTCQRYKRYF